MSVYGNKRNAKETDEPKPISWYGRHKLLSENLINQFSEMRKNILCNSLRLFNVYGEGQDLQDLKQGMISIFISMAIKEKFIRTLINFFLLIPFIQNINNSLFFSYFNNSKNIEIAKTKGNIL